MFLNSGTSFSVSSQYMLLYDVPEKKWVWSLVKVIDVTPPNKSLEAVIYIV